MELYFPWSSTCSSRVELAVQSTLQEIRHESMEPHLPCLSPCSSRVELAVQSTLQDIRHESMEESPEMPIIVVWEPPLFQWVKVNTDGASRGNPGLAASGGVFRSSSCDFLGGFSVFLGYESAEVAEFMAVIHAIKFAYLKGWFRIWVESDSLTVVHAIQNRRWDKCPSKRRRVWEDCLKRMKSMHIYCSHIYREGNRVADIMAKLVLKYRNYPTWHKNPPQEIKQLLSDDYWGLPNYRLP